MEYGRIRAADQVRPPSSERRYSMNPNAECPQNRSPAQFELKSRIFPGAYSTMAWLMCRAFGVAGLWWTYPLNAAVLFAGVLLGTRWLAAKSAGRYTGLLLAERDDDALESCDFTMTGRPDADARNKALRDQFSA